MATKRRSGQSGGNPTLVESDFPEGPSEEFAGDTDFKAWARHEIRPEEITIPENRRRYEAYLAKHDIKL